MWLVGVGGIYGCGYWVWLLGVVVRRYIDFLIQLIPTPLVSVLFAAASLLFVIFNIFFVLVYIYTYTRDIQQLHYTATARMSSHLH